MPAEEQDKEGSQILIVHLFCAIPERHNDARTRPLEQKRGDDRQCEGYSVAREYDSLLASEINRGLTD